MRKKDERIKSKGPNAIALISLFQNALFYLDS